MNFSKIAKIGFVALFLVVLSYQSSFAANGMISVVPENANKNLGQTFDVDVKIDGAGTAFNAAKATVSLSPSISIQDLTLGDCNFAFVKTPTKSDPSFVGVSLGTSSTSCTVYSLTLRGETVGKGYITISDASIKQYKTAAELLSLVKNGSYTIAGNTSQNSNTNIASVTAAPTQSPAGVDGVKVYDVLYTVLLPNNIPASSVTVAIDPELSTKMSPTTVSNQDQPRGISVKFQNVGEGVHTVTAFSNGKPISTQVLNISGANKEFAFGTTAKQPSLPIIWYIVAIILIAIAAFFGYKYWLSKNKKTGQPQSPDVKK